MDVFNEEILLLWQVFEKYQVKYIMVGGFATALHGFLRTTADADFIIKDTEENRNNLVNACKELELPGADLLRNMQFIPGWTSLILPGGLELDIMTEIKGFNPKNFDNYYEQASVATIYGIKVPFLHLNHLIEVKKASGRSKDLIDLEELIKIMNEREKNSP